MNQERTIEAIVDEFVTLREGPQPDPFMDLQGADAHVAKLDALFAELRAAVAASPLTFLDYQRQAQATAVYPFDGRTADAISYCMLGLCGEAGETADKWKKVLRDKGGVVDEPTREALKKELGDVCWYLSQLSLELGFDFGDVAAANLEKLAKRAADGKLHGEGDNR